ncbi:MAG: Unknown protein [uncultured Thiotrichaceae bacterium]|uniref:Uncharacterized protein n=1 Tax=uncultured Thiotrichaceae bacterium TaxID=298394 RepID=A0A6S6U3A4_9GAMM|nr:MAG: Unknown protein [uncultured Thiotrichaceae bacterium]
MFLAPLHMFFIQYTNKTLSIFASVKSVLMLTLCTLLLSGCNQDYEIGFYTFEKAADYKPASKVPLRPGLNYGWILKAPLNKNIQWKEELVLPSSSGQWANESASSDTLTTEKTEKAQLSGIFPNRDYGRIGNIWTVAPGDPEGIYQYKIYIDGELIKSFEIDFYKESNSRPN